MLKKILFASCGAIALGSCGSMGGGNGRNDLYEDAAIPFGQMTSAPFPIDKSALNKIDLLNLIDPENRRVRLAGEGLCGAHNVFAQGNSQTPPDTTGKRTMTDASFDGTSARSVPELRDQYLFLRYNQIVEQLLKLGYNEESPPTGAQKKQREALLKEKSKIEEEAKKLGADLNIGEKLNPAIELNCALYAFHTYYLSFPQFEFAIRDLSSFAHDTYAWDLFFDDDAGFDQTEQNHRARTTEEISKAIEGMSQNQQARLRAYFAAGLYEKFYEESSRSIAIAMRRNAIQDQVMVHSENYCRFFKTQLHDTDIKVNMMTGIASTVLGGLATIFTDPTTVRALAGSAAIVSGGQSKYNEVMFANLAVQTVIAGIDLKRERILRDINEKRFFPLDKDDIEEFKGLDNDGVLNPGMFNTYGIRASVGWDHLYGEENGKLTYAGAPVERGRDKLGNLTFQPPVFSFSDLVARASFQETEDAETPSESTTPAAENAETDAAAESSTEAESAPANKAPTAVSDVKETKEDHPVIIDVLKNDTDPDDGDKEKLTIENAEAQSGTISIIEDKKKLKYTPNANFHGKDFIVYWITDGKKVGDKKTSVKGFVEVTVKADGEEPPAKKYLGLASIGVYSVEASLRDAVRFQTSCSLADGLTEATKAMEQARAPSVETLTNSLKQMEQMMQATESLRRAIDRAANTDKPDPKNGEAEE